MYNTELETKHEAKHPTKCIIIIVLVLKEVAPNEKNQDGLWVLTKEN